MPGGSQLIKSYKFLIAGVLVYVAACTTTTLELPPITSSPTGSHLQGKVIWHELLTEDMAAAKQFYGGLFGWSFEPIGGADEEAATSNYTVVYNNGKPIAGLIDATLFEDEHENLSQWVSVISVGDIDYTTTGIRKMGGSVLGGPTDLAERGHMSAVADPQGALFAILQTSTGDPADMDPAIGDFLWDELWTNDTAKATGFYTSLLGYEIRNETLEDGSAYEYLAAQGFPRAAIIDNPIVDLDPTWVSFIRVEDAAGITARVEALGGKVLLEPQANPVGGRVAIITDPTGAGVVIQTWDKSRVGRWRIQQ